MLRIRRLGLLVAIVSGCISAWEGRFDMDADGVSYLDMAEAYARRDWENALNSIWSPLYSWILMLFLRGLKPNAYWEFPLVQGVNLLIYLGALAAFTYCLRQLILYRQWRTPGETSPPAVRVVPEWLVYAAGYAVFLWGTLVAIGISNVTPHMTMAAQTFLATALLLRLRMHPDAWWSWAAFGLVLGLGYLARAQSLVFIPVYLVLAVLPPPAGWTRARRAVPRLALALGVVVMVASVYAVPLFVVKKQIAGQDLVRLNYAWYVNDVPVWHWQGDPPHGTPANPTRVLLTAPTVYEFDGPVGGTYPPWYDPSYWYRGVTPQIDLMGQLRRWTASIRLKPRNHLVAFHWWVGVLVYVFLTGLLLRQRLLPWGNLRRHAGLLIPALIAVVVYPGLTLLPQRFLGAVLPMLWLGTIASISWRANRSEGARTATAVVVGVVLFHMMLSVAVVGARAWKSVVAPPSHAQWRTAQALHAAGVPPGSKVAAVGRGAYFYWARLARVRIVAEIPERFAPEFWGASDEQKRTIMTMLRGIGVKTIVVHPRVWPGESDPGSSEPWSWIDLGGTGYIALILR